MEYWLAAGISLVVLGALSLICWGYLRHCRRRESDTFDERQRIAQGQASRISDMVCVPFFLGLVVYLMHGSYYGRDLSKAWMGLYFAVLLKWMTYDLYCVFAQAALPVGEEHLAKVLICGGLAASQVLRFRDSFRWTEPVGMGMDMVWTYIVGAVCFGLLAVCHLVAMLRKEKEI